MSASDRKNDLVSTFLLRYENPRTRRAYRTDLRRFFDQESVDANAARSVDRERIHAYLRRLAESGRSGATIRRCLAAVRSFFGWLCEIDLLEANPAGPVAAPSTGSDGPSASSSPPVVGLTREQVRRLVAATSEAGEADVRDRALILTLVYGMLRRSDAARMDVRHVEIRSASGVVDLAGAVDRPFRPIRLPGEVADAIELVSSVYGIVDGPLWRSLSRNHTRGDRLSADGIYRMVRRTAERAGMTDRIGARALRQTGCVLALAGGASAGQVADHAGYRSVDTVRRYESASREHGASGAAEHIDLGM